MACPVFQSLTLPVLQSPAGGQELRSVDTIPHKGRTRLDAHVVVEKRAEGSRVRVEVG